jgi:Domain of unknown function (DUF397)
MATAASSRAAWRRSSHSGANGDCVEIALHEHALIAVRDSTDPGGPRLAFTARQWTAFTATLKNLPGRQAR